jgi:hypothetical protein
MKIWMEERVGCFNERFSYKIKTEKCENRCIGAQNMRVLIISPWFLLLTVPSQLPPSAEGLFNATKALLDARMWVAQFDIPLSGLRGRGSALLIKMQPKAKMREDDHGSAILSWKRWIRLRVDDIIVETMLKTLRKARKGVK